MRTNRPVATRNVLIPVQPNNVAELRERNHLDINANALTVSNYYFSYFVQVVFVAPRPKQNTHKRSSQHRRRSSQKLKNQNSVKLKNQNSVKLKNQNSVNLKQQNSVKLKRQNSVKILSIEYWTRFGNHQYNHQKNLNKFQNRFGKL